MEEQWRKGRNHDKDWSGKFYDIEKDLKAKDRYYDWYTYPHDMAKGKESRSNYPNKFKSEDVLACILLGVDKSDRILRELKSDLS